MTGDGLAAAEIRGAIGIERTAAGILPRRLPASSLAQIPDAFMEHTVRESAGIRLAFATEATRLELEVSARRMVPDEVVPIPAGWYELVVDGQVAARVAAAAGSRYLFSFADPSGRRVDGPPTTVRFDSLRPGRKQLELWLPFTEEVELRSLRGNAPIEPPAPVDRPVWLHHGSSISHGYRADSTLGTWPVVAARTAGVELVNLGFSGSAMLDQLTARAIRDAPADAISIKVGINLVNGDVMRLRAFRPAVHGFLDTIRDGHPDTPLLVVTPIWCEPVEEAAGPTVQDPSKPYEWSIAGGTREDVAVGRLSLQVIRAELTAIVAARRAKDPRLGVFDGLRLYGPEDAAEVPLPDNLHPDPIVQRRMGERFAALALPGLLAGRPGD